MYILDLSEIFSYNYNGIIDFDGEYGYDVVINLIFLGVIFIGFFFVVSVKMGDEGGSLFDEIDLVGGDVGVFNVEIDIEGDYIYSFMIFFVGEGMFYNNL